MPKLKFVFEFALVVILAAGIIWAVRERMQIHKEALPEGYPATAAEQISTPYEDEPSHAIDSKAIDIGAQINGGMLIPPDEGELVVTEPAGEFETDYESPYGDVTVPPEGTDEIPDADATSAPSQQPPARKDGVYPVGQPGSITEKPTPAEDAPKPSEAEMDAVADDVEAIEIENGRKSDLFTIPAPIQVLLKRNGDANGDEELVEDSSLMEKWLVKLYGETFISSEEEAIDEEGAPPEGEAGNHVEPEPMNGGDVLPPPYERPQGRDMRPPEDAGATETVPGKKVKVVIGLVGDVDIPEILKSQVNADPEMDLLSGVSKVRDRCDILAGNLEAQLTLSNASTSAKTPEDLEEKKEFLLKDEPKWANYLKRSGFVVLSIANNHALDFSWKGLHESLNALNNAGIAPVGGGADENAARSPRFIKVKGKTIGFLAYSTVIPAGYGARKDRPGIAAGRGDDRARLGSLYTKKLTSEVKAARARCDFLVVSYHWGIQGSRRPDALSKDIAYVVTKAGADVVFGHGPHVLQSVEMINGVPVAWSLSDFIWHKDKHTGLLEIVLDENDSGRLVMRAVRLHECEIESGIPKLTGDVKIISEA